MMSGLPIGVTYKTTSFYLDFCKCSDGDRPNIYFEWNKYAKY